MRLSLQPVYSKLADPAQIPVEVARCLPDGWHLSQHQLETYRALMSRDADVILNTAMTGDGKSLAAYLPTLVDPQRHAFGMYPTIELSRDQQRQFRGYAASWQREIRSDALWGARLGQLAKEQSVTRRGEILKERLDNYDVLLTNPDIFNLVMNYRYGSLIYSDVELPYSLSVNFDDLIFDEFHIFSMPQIVSAITAMLYLIERDPRRAPRFLFSSATPDPTFLQMLGRAGLRVHEITGDYTTSAGADRRHVLHQAELSLHQLSETQGIEPWLDEHVDSILEHWRRNGGNAKGAIILNSVVTARRVARLLAERLKLHGITVGEVTGLTDDERRRATMEQAALIVGTSTIDVGVDFNISLLIFETLDAGTFLQRLGRLGRVRRGEAAFEYYEAHALFSGRMPWLHARLIEGLKARGVQEDTLIDRPGTLREAVMEAFPSATAFKPYARRWGIMQAAHVVATLAQSKHQGAYASHAEALQERYARLFDVKDFAAATKYYWVLAGKKKPAAEARRGQMILDEVLSFRGRSPFQAAVYDATVTPPALIDYDALALVQHTQFGTLSATAYRGAAARQSPGAQNEAEEALRWAIRDKNDEPLALQISQFFEERESLVLNWESNLRNALGQVCVLKGCFVAAPRNSSDIGTLNQFLRQQPLVCYFTSREIGELRRILRLPPYFALYRVEQSQYGKTYTVAFGKTALLLDAEMIRCRGRDEANEPIIC